MKTVFALWTAKAIPRLQSRLKKLPAEIFILLADFLFKGHPTHQLQFKRFWRIKLITLTRILHSLYYNGGVLGRARSSLSIIQGSFFIIIQVLLSLSLFNNIYNGRVLGRAHSPLSLSLYRVLVLLFLFLFIGCPFSSLSCYQGPFFTIIQVLSLFI